MNKLLLTTALSAALLAPLAAQAQTDDTTANDSNSASVSDSGTSNYMDGFFVGAQVGRSNARLNEKDFADDPANVTFKKKSNFQSVTFGWRWNGIVGPEIGYTNLGKVRMNGADLSSVPPSSMSISLKTKALLLGVNARYGFAEKWYVMGHAGLMRVDPKQEITHALVSPPGATSTTSVPMKKTNSWYAGVGVGYDITKNFSVGLNYDNYRVKLQDKDKKFKNSFNTGTYSVALEYRF